jgi:hypothetical protein
MLFFVVVFSGTRGTGEMLCLIIYASSGPIPLEYSRYEEK